MLPPDVTVHQAAERMLGERRLTYAVMDGGQVAGLLTLQAVQAVRGAARDGEARVPLLPVVAGNELVGVVSSEDIQRGLMLVELEDMQRRTERWPPGRRAEAPTY